MDFSSLHQSELSLMNFLQVIRSPLLDSFMIFLNNFDTFPVYCLAWITVWYGYSQRCGRDMLFLFVIGAIASQDFKALFAQPRPCALQPTLGLMCHPTYGFPSGAATVWASMLGVLAFSAKKRWVWICSVLALLLISFSRVYLGLHFPSDVVGGWVIGVILLGLYCLISQPLEKWLEGQTKTVRLVSSVVAAAFLLFASLSPKDSLPLIMIALGAGVGLIFAPPLAPPVGVSQPLGRVLITLLGAVAIDTVFSAILPARAVVLFFMGLWIVLASYTHSRV